MTSILLVALMAAGSDKPEGCAVVDRGRVLASDLAGLVPALAQVPPETLVGYAPAPGLMRWWRGAHLRAIALRFTSAVGDLPDVCVERPARVATRVEVVDALRRALPEQATLELEDYCRLPIPDGRIEFNLKSLARPAVTAPAGLVLWRGRVAYEANRSAPFWARVRVSIVREGYWAARPIPQGRLIAEADLIKATRTVSLFSPAPAAEADEVIGRVTRRALAEGAALDAALLAAPPDVNPGDRLKVSVESGLARLVVDARAATGGRRGDQILVENAQTGKRFKATVVGRGSAVVQMEESNAQEHSGRRAASGQLGSGGAKRDTSGKVSQAEPVSAGPDHPGS